MEKPQFLQYYKETSWFSSQLCYFSNRMETPKLEKKMMTLAPHLTAQVSLSLHPPDGLLQPFQNQRYLSCQKSTEGLVLSIAVHATERQLT